MKAFTTLTLIPLLLVSCASDSDKGKSSSSSDSEHKSMNERFAGSGQDPNSFTRDAKGNWVAKSKKRSPYESIGQDPNFQKDGVKKKEYKTGDYAKNSWWGNKDYDRKSYTGNTDGSRFTKSSSLQDKGAREADTAAKIRGDYQTSAYTTGDAREAGGQTIAKPSNDRIENRRNSYAQPEIIGWKEQRTLSMQQSKGILGR